jgi:hypothetical protein
LGRLHCRSNLFGEDEGSSRNGQLCDMIVDGAAREGLSDDVVARRYEAWKNADCDK